MVGSPTRAGEPWHGALGRPGWEEYVGSPAQVHDVRLVELADGAGRGTRVLEFHTAAGLQLDVVVDRGFDLGRCSWRGLPVSWVSPVGIRNPGLVPDEHLGWLRGFGGGLLATAGLDHTMFPERDVSGYYDYPPRAEESFPLHGRISREPARLLGYGVEQDPDRGPVLWAEGEVTQAAVFGEVLRLHRRIEVSSTSGEIRLRDEVSNQSHTPLPHMLLYHVNLGWPLLESGSRLVTNATRALARGEHPPEDHNRFTRPGEAPSEQVTQLEFGDGTAHVALINDKHDIAFTERFPTSQLPYLFVWRVMGRGTYVLGLEPSTNGPEGRAAARAAERLRVLEPGEAQRYHLDLSITTASGAAAELGLPPASPDERSLP